ncbi:entericidin A/B family lipoprotein [Rickettsia hoogstraalii]|uniref:entericidin A/B family lipoprotein n=1 Tax=Rickettsia hoogstraalii TaxID=467174 RepID=UPI0005907C8F|nr:entericidin A/B family lipoprotein [Rickettsia hoogstraalii]
MRSALITSILVAVAFLTSACNTMQGADQDMQAAGKKLEDSAERNKPKKSCGCPYSSTN